MSEDGGQGRWPTALRIEERALLCGETEAGRRVGGSLHRSSRHGSPPTPTTALSTTLLGTGAPQKGSLGGTLGQQGGPLWACLTPIGQNTS